MSRVLFICKKNEGYGGGYSEQKGSGLFNSTNLIAEALNLSGVHAKVVIVQDNNSIDKEVTQFRPDIVVIEALWVVPGKFDVLKKLHPSVSWYVHIHSNIPFLANEGIAFDWLQRYAEKSVGIIANSIPAFENLRVILGCEEIIYLPNVYSRKFYSPRIFKNKEHVDIGCFGAIRPMKNQVLQALAAIRYAREVKKPLRFHINASRVELGGEGILKNLKELFKNQPDAKLIEHPWHGPHAFLKFLNSHIDIGLQVSMSETFNVVTADYVAAGIPVVVSEEISWTSFWNYAELDSVDSLVSTMHFVAKKKLLVRWNQHLLEEASTEAIVRWLRFTREC